MRNDLVYYNFNITKKSTGTSKTLRFKEHASPIIQYLTYEFKNLERGETYIIQMQAVAVHDLTGAWSKPFTVKTVTQLAPLVLTHPVDANIGEGNNVTIQCIIMATPPAYIRWYKDNKIISLTDSRYTVNTISGNLTIHNALHGFENSEGSYYCTGKNIYRSVASNTANVSVECKCIVFEIRGNNHCGEGIFVH